MTQPATTVTSSSLGSSLQQLLLCDEIVPGSAPSYETCKTIYVFHPIGEKIASMPIREAQSMPRDISIQDGPEERVREAFLEEWKRIGADNVILNLGTQARVYGIASMAIVEAGVQPATALEIARLADADISFNVLDPLNTAGSLVLNQDPNAIDFQKHRDIAVNGVRYHRSRTVTLMNENPIYIAWSNSAYGFVGRSVYQRALFPLKSYVQTMRANDMVSRKVGLIIAKLKMPGSIADAVMDAMSSFKRQVLRLGETDNVLSVSTDEEVASLDLTNIDGPLLAARKNILEDIAAAVPMPAKLLNNETFAEGFGEGTEDAKAVAKYCDGIRAWLDPAYVMMDEVVQRRAWNKRFFEAIQKDFPDDWGKVDYEQAFYRWKNSFKAVWPSLLQEPESERVEVDKVKFETVVATVEVLAPMLDPENKAELIRWMCDNLNENQLLFTAPLHLDYEAIAAYEPSVPGVGEAGEEGAEPKPPKPMRLDAGSGRIVDLGTQRRIGAIEAFLRVNGRGISAAQRRFG